MINRIFNDANIFPWYSCYANDYPNYTQVYFHDESHCIPTIYNLYNPIRLLMLVIPIYSQYIPMIALLV